MGNCKDCKYWDIDAFSCGCVCTKITEMYRKEDLVFIATSHFKARAQLRTKPDFGCVLFEQKEKG